MRADRAGPLRAPPHRGKPRPHGQRDSPGAAAAGRSPGRAKRLDTGHRMMLAETRMSHAESAPPSVQVIGESALAHHLDLYDRLADRRRESAVYRALLEDVLGFSLEHAVISTSEHAAPF